MKEVQEANLLRKDEMKEVVALKEILIEERAVVLEKMINILHLHLHLHQKKKVEKRDEEIVVVHHPEEIVLKGMGIELVGEKEVIMMENLNLNENVQNIISVQICVLNNKK